MSEISVQGNVVQTQTSAQLATRMGTDLAGKTWIEVRPSTKRISSQFKPGGATGRILIESTIAPPGETPAANQIANARISYSPDIAE